jgi:hypothetical protein
MDNKPINFIASVDPSARFQIHVIADKLREKGCEITNILKITGVITGCSAGDEASLEDLKVTGIRSIEEDREVGAI